VPPLAVDVVVVFLSDTMDIGDAEAPRRLL